MQNLFSLTFTAFDLLAEILAKAIHFGKAAKSAAIGVVQAMLGFLGRTGSLVTEASISFLRWVLSAFFFAVSNKALRAMLDGITGRRIR